MMVRERIAVYFANLKNTNAQLRKHSNLFNIKVGETYNFKCVVGIKFQLDEY